MVKDIAESWQLEWGVQGIEEQAAYTYLQAQRERGHPGRAGLSAEGCWPAASVLPALGTAQATSAAWCTPATPISCSERQQHKCYAQCPQSGHASQTLPDVKTQHGVLNSCGLCKMTQVHACSSVLLLGWWFVRFQVYARNLGASQAANLLDAAKFQLQHLVLQAVLSSWRNVCDVSLGAWGHHDAVVQQRVLVHVGVDVSAGQPVPGLQLQRGPSVFTPTYHAYKRLLDTGTCTILPRRYRCICQAGCVYTAKTELLSQCLCVLRTQQVVCTAILCSPYNQNAYCGQCSLID